MKRSLVLLILSALLAFGCSKQTSPNEQPKPAPEPEAKPTPPAKKAPETESALPVGHDPVACKADDECELSHYIVDKCCGLLCSATNIYNKETIALLRAWHEKRCKKAACPVASCTHDTTVRSAVCKAGQCTLVEKKAPKTAP